MVSDSLLLNLSRKIIIIIPIETTQYQESWLTDINKDLAIIINQLHITDINVPIFVYDSLNYPKYLNV